MPAPNLSETQAALCLFLLLMVPAAAAGLALINTGLGRARSAAHSMTASLCVFGVASCVYCVCGFAWQGFAGGPWHGLWLGGRPWDWLGAGPFLLRGLALDGSAASLAALLGMLGAGLAATIPLGSGADRWRLGASCISAALLAGWTYPLFAHWVWGGGWLARLGTDYGLGRGFLDAGGSGAIQAAGGLTALSITWILGPRRGKYSPQGMPSAIPGHNVALVMHGCLLALLGWLGLNGAGSILFAGAGIARVALVAMNTIVPASAAALSAAAMTRVRFGKPDASLIANGWVGGLAASSAGCALVAPAAAVAIGLAAGVLVVLSVEWLELRLRVDDPGGSVSVHAVGGLWGVLAPGLFASFAGQWLAQFVGFATLLGFVLPMTYGLNWLVNRFYRQKVALEGERQGMDLYELGAGAYPEFVTTSEDLLPR
jgi:Amt family ammonium transporter